jgi:putative membrane protein
MSTLFAFLHHLCAFTLVSAVAIEFVLIRSELTLTSARRLQVTDMVLGVAAGLLLIVGLSRVFFFEKGASYYFHSPAFIAKFSIFIAIAFASDHPDRRIPVMGQAVAGRAVADRQRQAAAAGNIGHPLRACRYRHHPALRRDHGAGRVGVGRAPFRACVGTHPGMTDA